MNIHASEEELLKHLANAMLTWKIAGTNALSDPSSMQHPDAWIALSECLKTPESKNAFATAMTDMLGGLIHTTLVAFDGGSSLSDRATLTIRDQDGHEFIRFLHEFWPQFRSDAV